jgi:hypothetical protein
MFSSTELIELAKEHYTLLERKGFDEASFINGFIDGMVTCLTYSEIKKKENEQRKTKPSN